MLNGAFSASLAKFVENTGISEYHRRWLRPCSRNLLDTLLLVDYVIINVIMLAIKKTDTRRRCLRYLALVYHWSFESNGMRTTELAKEFHFSYAHAVVLVGIMKIINSDLIKTNNR